MVAPTAHRPDDLAFRDADDRRNLVTYTAPSASHPGETNTCTLDVLTMQASCDCRGAHAGRPRWHVALIDLAWERHPVCREARHMTTAQLAAMGLKAARMCRVYRRRTWNTLPADRVALVAARGEWRRRRPVAVALAEDLPPAA